MYSKINEFVSKRVALTKSEYDYFNDKLQYKTFKKKEIILEPGVVCNFEGYVLKGLFRMYCINESGNETDLLFASEDWWIGDLISFSQRIPSKLYIQALEDSEVLLISYENKELLFNKIPALERLFRLMVQKAFETMMNRLLATISETAESRYLQFIKRYPSIPLRVPQHMIASYLGITPEFLSKTRAKLSKK
jgi:CRP/FNR family cyclic AMP-dependent transcriptional regulator